MVTLLDCSFELFSVVIPTDYWKACRCPNLLYSVIVFGFFSLLVFFGTSHLGFSYTCGTVTVGNSCSILVQLWSSTYAFTEHAFSFVDVPIIDRLVMFSINLWIQIGAKMLYLYMKSAPIITLNIP